jgi:hypothetical protein
VRQAGRVAWGGFGALGLVLTGWLLAAASDHRAASAIPPSAGSTPPEAGMAGRDTGPPPKPDVPVTPQVTAHAGRRLRVMPGFEGRPAPGLQVQLKAVGAGSGPLSYRWIQTRGSEVTLDDPTSARPRFIVPERAGLLEFVLVAADGNQASTSRLTIAVEGGHPGVDLRADAGDDQVAVVGRRVTLNGLRSEPQGRIGFRWLQVAGPEVALPVEDGTTYSFVPTGPGTHRFALVVAHGEAISMPDMVEVRVGTLTGPEPVTPFAPPPAPAPTLSQLAGQALAAVAGGPDVSEELAAAFEEAASRVDLYESYGELYGELSRRLEPVLPVDPGQRQHWDQALFAPLTAQVVQTLSQAGLDPRTPHGLSAPLPEDVRQRLAAQFREMAAGFRQCPAGRTGPAVR